MVTPTTDTHRRKLQLHFRRFEVKYLITPAQGHGIRRYVANQMRPDPYTENQGNYLVTSVYLDSPGLRFYRDNEAGLKCRQKVRYRFYNLDRHHVFWEIKRKVDSVVFKDRCLADQPSAEMKNTLQAYKSLFRLRPVTWIRYLREPWVGDRDLRVTFDRDLGIGRTTHADGTTPQVIRPIFAGREIMELKYSGRLPAWLYGVITQFNLERSAISKYRLSIEKLGMV